MNRMNLYLNLFILVVEEMFPRSWKIDDENNFDVLEIEIFTKIENNIIH